MHFWGSNKKRSANLHRGARGSVLFMSGFFLLSMHSSAILLVAPSFPCCPGRHGRRVLEADFELEGFHSVVCRVGTHIFSLLLRLSQIEEDCKGESLRDFGEMTMKHQKSPWSEHVT